MVMAAGDIACSASDANFNGGAGGTSSCREMAVSGLALGAVVDAVLPLGDLQYDCGETADWQASYDKSWGRLLSVSHPAIGNHEYGRACGRNDATPYFDYFGARAGADQHGWYSYDLGTWHLIALNSECKYGTGAGQVGGCGPGSPQMTWLQNDLATHPTQCTLAYWHEPRFSSGEHGDAQQMTDIWNVLVQAKADIVLSGHNHDYERFDPAGVTPVDPNADPAGSTTGTPSFQDPVLDPTGIRSWVVGTGGKNHYGFTAPALQGEVVRNSDTFGALKLTLHDGSYDWEFVPEPGKTFTDSGTGLCH